jgi:hypothetical protein
MQEIIRENLLKIALPALLASAGAMAFYSGVVPKAWAEFTRKHTGERFNVAGKFLRRVFFEAVQQLRVEQSGVHR